MEILSQLYIAAEEHLADRPAGWAPFIDAFNRITHANGSLYTQDYAPESPRAKRMKIIAARPDDPIHRYVEERVFEHEIVSKNQMQPLEPLRLSDMLQGRALAELSEPLAAFMDEVGVRHIIAVPAHLSAARLATLIVWRGPEAEDFSDLEKQRYALFMRHLMALVGQEALSLEEPQPDVEAFGRKWGLTGAETELLDALLRGMSLREVAEQSGRSYGTVRWHMQNILSKCQVGSQKDLLREFYALIRR